MKKKSFIANLILTFMAFALCFASLFFVSCGSDADGGGEATVVVAQVKSVYIDGTAKVGSTLTAVPEYATGTSSDATFVWSWSDSRTGTFTTIDGATGISYKVPATYAEKFIKVTVTKNGASESDITSKIAKGTISSNYTLAYGENGAMTSIVVEKGANLNAITVSGAKDATDGSDISDVTATFSETSLQSSKEVGITVSATGYDSLSSSAFITVKAMAPDATRFELDDAVSEISAGCVRFKTINGEEISAENAALYEYSKDGSSWAQINTSQFVADVNDTIYVRVKAVGTEHTNGYVAASDASSSSITVSANNAGTKPASAISVILAGDIELAYSVENDSVIFEVSSENDGFADFAWEIDGENITSATGHVIMEDGKKLTLTAPADIPSGTSYSVTVKAKKNGFWYSSTATVTVEE